MVISKVKISDDNHLAATKQHRYRFVLLSELAVQNQNLVSLNYVLNRFFYMYLEIRKKNNDKNELLGFDFE